jgi:hypothetical protein
MARPAAKPAYDLTDAEKRDLIRLIQEGRPFRNRIMRNLTQSGTRRLSWPRRLCPAPTGYSF